MPAVTTRLEPGRLRRGAQLAIRRVGPRRYVVAGSNAPWFVDLDQDPPCGCEDNFYRGKRVGKCKHEYAALLQERDPAALEALARVYEVRLRSA